MDSWIHTSPNGISPIGNSLVKDLNLSQSSFPIKITIMLQALLLRVESAANMIFYCPENWPDNLQICIPVSVLMKVIYIYNC